MTASLLVALVAGIGAVLEWQVNHQRPAVEIVVCRCNNHRDCALPQEF